MRCPDCSKFVSMDTSDPEVEDVNIDGTMITVNVHLVRCCSDCGTELKETTLSTDTDIDFAILEGHMEEDGSTIEGHEVTIDENSDCSSTERTEGKGRGLKTFIGYEMDITVSCSCQETPLGVVHVEDEEQASSFDEMV